MAEWAIERLTEAHDREQFSCGKPPLDKFIRELAGRYEKQRIGRTHVAVPPGEKRVVGYHTLAAGAVPLEHLPKKHARGLPHHPQVPVILLGRLAVDQSMKGKGLGSDLLVHALQLALATSDRVAAFAVEVLAIDEEAAGFYAHHGFKPLLDQPAHMYLPMGTVRQLFGR